MEDEFFVQKVLLFLYVTFSTTTCELPWGLLPPEGHRSVHSGSLCLGWFFGGINKARGPKSIQLHLVKYMASHPQKVVRYVRGHDKPRLMGVAIAIDPFQVVYNHHLRWTVVPFFGWGSFFEWWDMECQVHAAYLDLFSTPGVYGWIRCISLRFLRLFILSNEGLEPENHGGLKRKIIWTQPPFMAGQPTPPRNKGLIRPY